MAELAVILVAVLINGSLLYAMSRDSPAQVRVEPPGRDLAPLEADNDISYCDEVDDDTSAIYDAIKCGPDSYTVLP